MSRIAKVSDRILERLTSYYHFLRKIDTKKTKCITSNKIAESLNISPILIRKDLFATRVKGKPKKGYSIHKLIIEIEKLLGWGDPTKAILIGCGNLGKTLLKYKKFNNYGLKIVSGFDIDEEVVGEKINGIQVFHFDDLEKNIEKKEPIIGIITTTEENAQKVADKLIELNVFVIWNFAPVFLEVPECVIVQQQELAPFVTVLLDKQK